MEQILPPAAVSRHGLCGFAFASTVGSKEQAQSSTGWADGSPKKTFNKKKPSFVVQQYNVVLAHAYGYGSIMKTA